VYKDSGNIQKRTGAMLETIGGIEHLAQKAEDRIEREIEPLRKSLLKRFPTVFLLLVTAGFILVSFAIEEILRQYSFFTQNPLFALVLGLFFLIITGTAYKKSQV
jgi:hypothetical protein